MVGIKSVCLHHILSDAKENEMFIYPLLRYLQ